MKTLQQLLVASLLLLLLSGTYDCYAQRSWNVTMGYAVHSVQDKGFSPLVYLGSGASFGVKMKSFKNTSRHQLSLDYTSMKVRPNSVLSDNFDLNQGDRTIIRAEYRFMRRWQHKEMALFSGIGTSPLFDLVNYNHKANNPSGYELNLPVNLNLAWECQIKKGWALGADFGVSLITYSIRPGLHGLFPTRNLEGHLGAALSQGKWGSPKELFKLQTSVYGSMNLGERQFTVEYEYQGGMNRLIEKRGTYSHRVALLVALNKYKK